ncbi:MAG: mprA 1 [Planctomycetaceae bacterium]|nr:mprA 1 [Planctomycetaceae bacterium]
MSNAIDSITVPNAVVHHILVVDEDRPASQAIKAFLEKQGYQVTVAKDGGQAHSTLIMKKPDFVIVEAMLSGETGYEICERIKKQENAMPVMFLTMVDIEESRDLAMRVGCDGYLTKPFEPDLLLNSIKAISEMIWRRTHNIEPVKESFIRFQCRCGKKLRVSEIHRGKHMTCPECAELLTVPRHG